MVVRKHRRTSLVVCVIAVASLVGPTAGSGRPRPTVLPRSLALEMQVRGSNGYSLTISGTGHRQVQVIATKDHYFAFYETTGSVSRDHIRADLGRFGRIAVHFEGTVRGLRKSGARCSGRRPIFETGSFRGAIEFDGEQGYTDVSARRASGQVYRTFKQVCRPGTRSGASAARSAGLTITLLAAQSREARRTVYLNAVRIDEEPAAERPPPWLLSAGLFERIGRIATSKTVYIEPRPAQIQVSAKGVHPASAEVAPGNPFLGTASFREAPDPTPEWTGTLSLDVPGVGVIPLAGESFDAVLCQTGSIRQLSRCSGTIEARSGPQISGSQSQLFGDARLSWAR
jgi:hypothetical protein